MALYKKLNYATGTLASGIADDAVEVVLNAGHSITTDTGIDNNFIGVFFSESESSPYQDVSREIVDAYRTDTNTFTITRAQEGTSARAWSQGDNFMLIASAGVFDEYETELDSKLNLDQTTPQTITNGSPAFSKGVDMANDKYLKGKNYAGTEYVNIIKVNTDNEAEVGVTMNTGTIEVEDDAGAVTIIDMGVTSASADGTEMSYTMRIDGNNILKIYSLADGAGGADSFAVKLLNSAGLDITETAGVADYDKFLVSDSGRVKYRTGAEVLSDIGGQASLGYTAENVANKKTSLTDNSDNYYPTQKAVKTAVDAKQDALGYTAENAANKKTTITESDTDYPTGKAVHTALAGKEATIGYTTENSANKKTSLTDNSDTYYPTQKAVKTAVDVKAPLASPTFTGTVILPKTTKIQDTSANHTYNLGVSELTADRTVTLPLLTGNDEFVFKDHTQTLTKKRINPRLVTAASYTTNTGTSLNVSTCDQFEITAQAGNLKFNNPSGTPLGGQKLIIRIKDNGTARALTYDTQFRAVGVELPATTVISKTLYMGFIFNATDTKWDLVAVANEE